MKHLVIAVFYVCLVLALLSREPDGRFVVCMTTAFLCPALLAWVNWRKRKKQRWG